MSISLLPKNAENQTSSVRERGSSQHWHPVLYMLLYSCLYDKGLRQLFKGLAVFILKIFIPGP